MVAKLVAKELALLATETFSVRLRERLLALLELC